MDATELMMLLDGIDVRYVRRAEHWQPGRKKRLEQRRGSTSRSSDGQSYLLAPPHDPEHESGWQGYPKSLDKRFAEVEHELGQLARHKSVKLPSLDSER